MKKHIIFLFIIFWFTPLISQTTLTGTAIAIKDDDTVVVLDNLNNQTTLRLTELDCPKNSQPFGNKGKQFTSQEIYRKQIKYDVTDIDRYGR
jgi:micrococcal nuclease